MSTGTKPFAVPDAVTAVVQECLGAFGDNLRAAVWQGSRARGEATETSDHDLILVFRRFDEGVLLRLRDIFRDRDHWSTVQWSEEEVRQLPADSRLQLAYGFHVLHGEFEPFRPTHEDVLAELRSLAEGIAFQCRYRLIHKRSDMPRQVRMMHYMAKNAILAMKARHLLTAGKYPVTRVELRPFITDSEEVQIIDWVEHWEEVRPGFEADPISMMLQLDRFARRLVAWLSRYQGSPA